MKIPRALILMLIGSACVSMILSSKALANGSENKVGTDKGQNSAPFPTASQFEDLLKRVRFLEKQMQGYAMLESTLSNQVHTTSTQVSNAASILAQVAEAQQRIVDDASQKTLSDNQLKQGNDSILLGMLGFIFTVAGVFIGLMGILEYNIVRYSLEQRLRTVNEQFLSEAKAKTGVAIYTKLSEVFSATYAKIPKTYGLFRVAVDLTAFFAEGAYKTGEMLRELRDETKR